MQSGQSKIVKRMKIVPSTHTNPKQKALICVCVCVLCRVVEKLVDVVRYAVYIHIPWFSLILLLLLIYQFFNSANSVAVDVDVHCTATSHRFIFVLCSTVLSFVLPVLLFSFYPFVCSLSQIRFSFSSPYRRCCCCCWHYWFSTFSTVAETFHPISSSIPSIPNTRILLWPNSHCPLIILSKKISLIKYVNIMRFSVIDVYSFAFLTWWLLMLFFRTF